VNVEIQTCPPPEGPDSVVTQCACCIAHSTQTEYEGASFLQVSPGEHTLPYHLRIGKPTKMLISGFFARVRVFKYYQGRMVEQIYFITTTKAERGNYQECCFLEV